MHKGKAKCNLTQTCGEILNYQMAPDVYTDKIRSQQRQPISVCGQLLAIPGTVKAFFFVFRHQKRNTSNKVCRSE
jgi:hypothetical protein